MNVNRYLSSSPLRHFGAEFETIISPLTPWQSHVYYRLFVSLSEMPITCVLQVVCELVRDANHMCITGCL